MFGCISRQLFYHARPMAGSILETFSNMGHWVSLPVWGLFLVFQCWMLVDAVRKREYVWVVLIMAGLGIAYFFYVYRNAPSATQGFELPGAAKRKRIKELEAQIHHLDNAVHHFHLGDIYFRQGKLEKAEAC
jgi:hypothetical protein